MLRSPPAGETWGGGMGLKMNREMESGDSSLLGDAERQRARSTESKHFTFVVSATSQGAWPRIGSRTKMRTHARPKSVSDMCSLPCAFTDNICGVYMLLNKSSNSKPDFD